MCVFSGSDSIFTRGKKGSRKLEERFSEKNKNVRICIKTRKVGIQIVQLVTDLNDFTD